MAQHHVDNDADNVGCAASAASAVAKISTSSIWCSSRPSRLLCGGRVSDLDGRWPGFSGYSMSMTRTG